jgi:hypothetical protein
VLRKLRKEEKKVLVNLFPITQLISCIMEKLLYLMKEGRIRAKAKYWNFGFLC